MTLNLPISNGREGATCAWIKAINEMEHDDGSTPASVYQAVYHSAAAGKEAKSAQVPAPPAFSRWVELQDSLDALDPCEACA